MDAPLRSTVPPMPPPVDHSAEIAALKAQVYKLTAEVSSLKTEIEKMWEKAKSFGVRK